MGDAADSAIAYILRRHENTRKRRKPTFQSRTGKGVWRTADGDVILMSDMTVAHLKAAIRECDARENSGKKKDLEKALENKTSEFFSPLDGL